MSKSTLQLRSAIQGLNMQKPFQLNKAKAHPEIQSTQNESTENRSTETKGASQGFFMLARAIFSDPMIRDLAGESFRVFLWLSMQAYRFNDSDGTTRASFRLMASCLGIAESSVGRSIEGLIKKRLIKRVEINNKIGNRWWVSPIAYGGGSPEEPERPKGRESTENESTENQCVQNECSENESEALPESKRSAPELGAQHTQNGGNLRTFQDSKNSKFLSLRGSGDSIIEAYFAETKPERKRQSERKAYESLLPDYSGNEIAEALKELKRLDPEGAKYHSPMAYLSVSMAQVLMSLRASKSSRELRQAKADVQQASKLADEEQKNRHEREWKEREALFLSTYRTKEEQDNAIAEFSAGAPFQNEVMRRGIAISRWWDSKGAKSEGVVSLI